MWKEYLTHTGTEKAQSSLYIHAVSPEPSLFDHTIYGAVGSFRQTTTSLTLVSGCTCSFEPRHDKTNKMSVLGVRPVWSESSLSAWRNLGSIATHWVHSEDSDQTGLMPRLTWVFAGRTLILLVLSCRGSNEQVQPLTRVRLVAVCLKLSPAPYSVWPNSEGSGETAWMCRWDGHLVLICRWVKEPKNVSRTYQERTIGPRQSTLHFTSLFWRCSCTFTIVMNSLLFYNCRG